MQFSILIIFLCLSFSIFGQAYKDGGFSVMKTKNPNVNQMKNNKTLGASTWEKTKNPNVDQMKNNKTLGASTWEKTKNSNVDQMKNNKTLGGSIWEKTKNPSIHEIEQKAIGTSNRKKQINSESININKRNKNGIGIKSSVNHKDNG